MPKEIKPIRTKADHRTALKEIAIGGMKGQRESRL